MVLAWLLGLAATLLLQAHLLLLSLLLSLVLILIPGVMSPRLGLRGIIMGWGWFGVPRTGHTRSGSASILATVVWITVHIVVVGVLRPHAVETKHINIRVN